MNADQFVAGWMMWCLGIRTTHDKKFGWLLRGFACAAFFGQRYNTIKLDVGGGVIAYAMLDDGENWVEWFTRHEASLAKVLDEIDFDELKRSSQ